MREEDKDERYTRPRQKRFSFHWNRWHGAPWRRVVEAIFPTPGKTSRSRHRKSESQVPRRYGASAPKFAGTLIFASGPALPCQRAVSAAIASLAGV